MHICPTRRAPYQSNPLLNTVLSFVRGGQQSALKQNSAGVICPVFFLVAAVDPVERRLLMYHAWIHDPCLGIVGNILAVVLCRMR